MADSKHTIKKRMMAIAAKSWGVAVKDIEKGDPIVPLLIDACAGEISRINATIDDSREKMIGKIMELLTPLELTSPFPARAVLHAKPMESLHEINENNQFYFEKKILIEEEVKDLDVFFTPTSAIKLLKGEIRYLAFGNKLNRKEGLFDVVEQCKAKSNEELGSNTLWIGMHLSKPVDSLAGISFYFDFHSEFSSGKEENTFYNALSGTQWEINGTPIDIINGYRAEDENEAHLLNRYSGREFRKARSICYHINSFYKKHFYTIRDTGELKLKEIDFKKKYPESFSSVFEADDLDELEGNLLWIKINFTQFITKEILKKINCSLNCFPVVNRRKERVFITGSEKIKGLESESNEVFLDLKDFSTSGNLKIFFDSKKLSIEEGSAVLSIRHDNIGRFSSRNALELIQLMINTYREEFRAFSKFKKINQDSIDSLNNAIRPFEYILDDLNEISFDSMPYVLFKTLPEDENKRVQVDYWLTNGSIANNIQREEKLKYDSAELNREEIYLMTASAGGVDRKRNEQMVNDFRYALISKDRIVTKMDIKALTHKVFDGIAEAVEVEEGITTTDQPVNGLRKCLEITVKLNSKIQTEKETVNFLKDDLLTQLNEKSSGVLPFVIHIQ